MLDWIVGGALVGIFTASLVNQFSGRVASKTIDLASEEVCHVIAHLKGEHDLETKAVLRALSAMDLEAKTKVAGLLLEQAFNEQNPVLIELLNQMQDALYDIKDNLRDIRVELIRHKQRFMHDYFLSNFRALLEPLRRNLSLLDSKIDIYLRLKSCNALTELARVKENAFAVAKLDPGLNVKTL